MTASQRRHLYSGLALGISITLFVVAIDAVGWLNGFENYLYKERALHCQRFTPRPTTQLVHLDIDDESLEEIGVLPWPRALLGQVIDELHLLGAKVIVMDIIMPDPQTTHDPGATTQPVDNDAALAAAIARDGHVLVPLSLTIEKESRLTAKGRWLADEFSKDLEIPLSVMEQSARAHFDAVSPDTMLIAREVAVRRVIARQADSLPTDDPDPVQTLGRRLLPKSWNHPGVGSEKLKDTVLAYARQEESRLALRRLARQGQPVGDMIHASGDLAPIPILARAAAYTGFVDHLPFDDGVVRAVPMWMEFHGTLFPFMGIRMACAMLDIPLNHVRIEPDRVIIPRDDGVQIILPAIHYQSAKLGKEVGMLFRIPWFGTTSWQTMYDYPNHAYPAQHVPFGLLWQAVKSRRAAISNNKVVDAALKQLVAQSDSDEARKFLQSNTPVDEVKQRITVTDKVIKEFDDLGWVAAFRELKPQEIGTKERTWLDAYDALIAARQANEQALADETHLKSQFNGKAVLIGSIASGAADFVTTPLHAQCPGAIVHGAVFNAIMTNFVWHDAPNWLNIAATLAVGFAATIAVAWLSPLAAAGAMVLLVVGYLGVNGYVVFDYGRYVMSAAGPVVAAGSIWGGVTIIRYIVERAERKYVTRRLGSYIDEQLVDYVLEHPERSFFEGEERELTVAFTDMKGFTSLMERLGKRIVPLLNEYTSRMVPIIQANGGYVNKFLGDGIMFCYGALKPNPDHAIDAVGAILDMQVAIREFNQWLAKQDLDPVAVRAGVNTGFMIVGDAGPRNRADYTVLGDTVNLASRLESANKYFGTAAMITDRTRELLDGRFLLRPIGRIRVVGKTAWVMAYEPLARAGEETSQQQEMVTCTQLIVTSYLEASFGRCLQAVEEAIARFGSQRLFEIYQTLARQHLGQSSDQAFDGAIELSEK